MRRVVMLGALGLMLAGCTPSSRVLLIEQSWVGCDVMTASYRPVKALCVSKPDRSHMIELRRAQSAERRSYAIDLTLEVW